MNTLSTEQVEQMLPGFGLVSASQNRAEGDVWENEETGEQVIVNTLTGEVAPIIAQETRNLSEAITTMPLHLTNGEYAHRRNIYRETEYDAIGWLLHKAGIDDKTLIAMEGNIIDSRNDEYIWLLVRHYGLTKKEARTIEDTNDHKSRAMLDEVLQIILREKVQVEKERVSA